MKIFSVHHKSVEPAIILSEGLETRFVKEGISWTALFFSPLWLIFHRMWLVLFGTFLLYVIAAVAADAVGLNSSAAFGLVLIVNVITALEGNDLRRWTLKRSGYQEIGVVTGRSLEHCERRFFESLLDPNKKLTQRHDLHATTSGVQSTLATLRPSLKENEGVVGLFPEPDPKP
tara:strand:+ start:82 stop:603 length:522 start_codon:yes stop_codon:yes gene_type:complete